ncbi:hypothetical protein FA15DRAFT_309772 [Coprinopsis marcescibilis]|uniref:CBS domain-containing protein n=1 Tax=Coprinopsis marcescibilis TaxID=230819 RepID=A0A5C3KZE9_COPMA|nr:hypothetical protein FA15DRAFT_309772 [Coprinopsis marcescibilis]
MSHSKRLSQSLNGSWSDTTSLTFLSGSDSDAEEWTETWKTVLARDLIDSRIVIVDAETSVEDACDKLSSEDVPCLVIKDETQKESLQYLGLFDYSDVNAFLTLAATRHTFSLDGSDADPRRDKIIEAAKAGPVSVSLVSNLSDKNPLICLEHDASIIDLLKVFCRGNHRVLIKASEKDGDCVGIVSDRGLLAWFAASAKFTPSFEHYLSNVIHPLSLPSSNAHNSVIAAFSSATILDAMRLMSDEGVSSVAVLDETGALMSTVSVTDVGKHVVPSQSNQFLSTPLHQFISVIKDPDGSTDGVDKYPVYSVRPSSQLLYTIEKILATNAHRVFVARESTLSSPVLGPAAVGNLCGIVSIVDILALFATLAGISNVDPTEMQRHRRQSSSASSSARSLSDFKSRSRSNSATATATQIQRSPSILALSSPVISPGINPLTEPASPSLAGIESIIHVAAPERKKSLRASKVSPTAVSATAAPP